MCAASRGDPSSRGICCRLVLAAHLQTNTVNDGDVLPLRSARREIKTGKSEGSNHRPHLLRPGEVKLLHRPVEKLNPDVRRRWSAATK